MTPPGQERVDGMFSALLPQGRAFSSHRLRSPAPHFSLPDSSSAHPFHSRRAATRA
ncbi:hypothetical protein SAMN05421773_102523 [Streptomyces aidingensis]|uniref:Uncharacterized protein n=1 Tax=Streptomyces aidingensis TaxID=910347 RepID=A0A1I1HV70_9ACTN|nr:hypothetical protein SAMN05421773_102523 [Streptomyces aidingensis]